MTGIEAAFFRFTQITADSVVRQDVVPVDDIARFAGGIVRSDPITINYERNQFAFVPASLFPPDGKQKDDYYTEMSSLLIERARTINALLNVLEAATALSGDGKSALPDDLRIEIGGHTDCMGTNNGPLSKNRATAIMKFLTSEASVARIVANSGGARFKPLIKYEVNGCGQAECACTNPPSAQAECRKITLRLSTAAA